MRLLIFGGAGFVGSNLAFHFRKLGWDVVVFDNLVRRGSEMNLPDFAKEGIGFVHGDIRNKEDLVPLGECDCVCECSAQPSAIDGYDNPYFDFSNNTIGLFNVLEYARSRADGLIFWSTNKVFSGDRVNAIPAEELATRYEWVDKNYNGINESFSIDGGQHSVYGMTKAMSDLAVQEYHDAFGLKTIVNRFSCLAGPRQFGKCAQGWVAWFVIAAIFHIPLKLIGWKGKQVRDILFVDDICSLVEKEMAAIGKGMGGEIFTIGGGKKNTVSLIEAIADIELMLATSCSEKTKIEYTVEEDPRKADHCVYITDTAKAASVFNWQPAVGVMDGLRQIHEWVLENYDALKRLYAQ